MNEIADIVLHELEYDNAVFGNRMIKKQVRIDYVKNFAISLVGMIGEFKGLDLLVKIAEGTIDGGLSKATPDLLIVLAGLLLVASVAVWLRAVFNMLEIIFNNKMYIIRHILKMGGKQK